MRRMFRPIAALLALLAACAPAAASLGEDAGSVLADQARLQATLEVTSEAKFAVHRLQLSSGVSVRQYVSPAGMVFAVTWQGPSLPDLRQLLGRYFDAYSRALRTASAGGARSVQQGGLAVETGGHMRALFGRVYIPTMLPRGVSADAIQ